METEKQSDTYREYPICRTCLNIIRHKSYRLQENSGCGEGLKISHILRSIVPELYLGLSNSPEICENCRECLRVSYTFRKLCLETETMIGNYLKNVRCTAQVIDLGAVINYLSSKKAQQNSSEETKVNSDESNPENLAKLLNKINESPKKLEVPLNKEEVKETKGKQFGLDSKEILLLNKSTNKMETLHFDIVSGFYINPSGRKYLIKNEKAYPIPDNYTIDKLLTRRKKSAKPQVVENKTVNKEDKIKKTQQQINSNINKILEKSITHKKESSETENDVVPERRDSITFSEPETETPIEESSTSNEPTMTVCEETGLLRNAQGDYFYLDGTPMDKDQVEIERNNAKVRGESLFSITDICTINDEDFEPSKNQQKSNKTKTSAPDSSKTDLNKKPPKVIGSISVKKFAELKNADTPLKIASKLSSPPLLPAGDIESLAIVGPKKRYRKILPNQKKKSTGRPSIFNHLNSMMKEEPEKILNFSFKIPPPLVYQTPPIEEQDKIDNVQFPTPTFDTLTPMVDVKEEPLDMEVPFENVEDPLLISHTDYDSLQNIIEPLASSDDVGNNYVDVPEFVQINNVDISEVNDSKKTNDVAEASCSIKESDQRPVNKPTITRLPFQLVKVGNHYKLKDKTTKTSNRSVVSKAKGKRKVKIVPVKNFAPNQNIQIQRPPKSDFVLIHSTFTTDGYYLNDHDYLITPYVRDKIVLFDGSHATCICYICGNVHRVDDHMDHMKNHESLCEHCLDDFGSPYNLNMHMKKSYKTCVRTPKQNSPETLMLAQIKKKDNEKLKRCFVPSCQNTSKNSKRNFVRVPPDAHESWAKAVGLPYTIYRKYWCCDDHFDIEDFVNFHEFKIIDGVTITKSQNTLKLKSAVVPHRNLGPVANKPRNSKGVQPDKTSLPAENQEKSSNSSERNRPRSLRPRPDRNRSEKPPDETLEDETDTSNEVSEADRTRSSRKRARASVEEDEVQLKRVLRTRTKKSYAEGP
ncbi:unnamed protein product [Phyllotreta striolata]|uniref:Uncharacterized protein n=1 Tax=Phyllotreta striolata TaxID=444603 RepID=A0A9N9TSN0_PHYSR|nr:unnamed protein product [Phyllotreta striolata]